MLAGEFRKAVERERMRQRIFTIRRCGRAVEDVIGADRYEDHVALARERRRASDRNAVDFERALGLGLATVDVVERRRVHQEVGTKPVERVAEVDAAFERELLVGRSLDIAIVPPAPDRRSELTGAAN